MSSAPALPQRNQNIHSNPNAIPSSNSNPFLAQEASSSSSSTSTPSDHLLLLLLFDPLFESDPSPFLLSLLASSDNQTQSQSQSSNQKSNPISRLSFPEKAKRFRNALLTSSSNNHLDLLYWLLDSKSPARRFLSNLESADATSTPSTSNQQSSPPPIDFKNILDSEGNGPMVLAASSGHVEAVRMLVRAGADVDERDPCGWTPLMWAVNSSNLPLVSFLLSHGADLEARSSSGTNCETFILSSSDQTPTTSHNGLSKNFLTSLEGVQSSSSRNLNSKTPQSPHSSDRELIAEMIYEFGQVSKEKNQKQSQKPKIGSLGSSSSLSSNSSVPGRGSLAALYQRGTSLNSTSNPPSPSPNSNFNSLSTSPTKKPTLPEGNNDNSSPFPKSPQNTLARKHSRSSSYNPNLNPKFDSLSSSGSKKSHNRHASLSIPSSPNPSSTNFGSRRLIGRNEKVLLAEKELKERELSESRRRALLDISITLEVDYSNLIGLPPITDENVNLGGGGGGGKPSNRSRNPGRSNQDNDRSRRKLFSNQKAVHSGLASGSGSSEVGANPLSLEFRFNLSRPLFSQLIVISSNDLPVLFDEIITNIKPVRAPWINRTSPANTLFLAARWCCLVKDADLLEDLLLGAVDRIQEIIYEKSKDLTYLAFWLSNCTILLHYLKRDKVMNIGDERYDEEDEDETLEVEDEINEDEEGNPIGRSSISSDATKNARTSRNNPKEDEEDPLNADLSLSLDDCRLFLLDLINELYVFVVRDVERRIDKVLDAALLDHDAIPGFGETKFEGEWNLIKSLAGSVKAATTSSNSGSLSSSPSGGSRRPISQIFNRNSLAVNNEKGNESSFASLRSTSSSPQKNNSPNMIGHGLPDSDSLNRPSGGDNLSRLRETSYDATAADLLSRPSPRTITTLLTSTLQTLQLYEINPSIIIQTFSQIFFWLSCELFNRILKNRKYLSRSRAMQIRLNISSLEDWSRNNAIPLGVIIGHLLPVKHLISWLQCQSSLKDFDGLIITLQGLKELTPKQMRRVVKDYRYEVGEERMSGECEQYLEQLELDWERRNEVNRKIEEEKERELEMKRKERKERRKAEKQSTKPTTSISSSHHRSGTATQNGYNHDSTPSSPSEEYDEADQSNRTALIDEEFEDEEGNGSDEDDDVSSTNSEDLPHSERIARSSQRAIDSLFTSGKSLNDYVPPWTTSGSSKGVTLKDNDRNGLLNSRDMLPFALPSDTEALIVTPGDSFGMGRGHWTGTGTPTLRSQAGSLISDDGASNDDDDRSVNSSISNLEDDDLDASVPPSPSPSNRTRERDRESVVSKQSSVNSETSSKCSNLYPQGKGFKSGSNWQPVPILPEGLLESLTDKFKENFIFRNNQSRLERLNAGLLSPSVAAPSPNFNEIDGFAQQRKFKAQESGHKSRAEYFGYEDSNDGETEEEQYYDEDEDRQRIEKMNSNKNQNRHSTFSAAPNKLVVPNRNQYQQQHSNINQSQARYAEPNFQEQSHRRNQSEDVELDTPTGLEPKGLSELKGRGMKSSSSEKTLKGGV